MFKTKITEMLGIDFPIIGGGMQWLSRAELTAAVSNAGGLGIMTSANFISGEELQREIRKAKDLTDKPFGVNVNLYPHRPLPTDEFIDVIIKEGVKAVETSGVRSPEEYVPRLREGGVKVIHKVATVKHAVKAQQVNVDAVAIVGFEAAGHIGMEDVSTLVLIPSAVAALEIPVIAGGGIADGRGFVAALVLGAQGVVIGTRFMATKECPLLPNVKQWLIESKETETMLIQRAFRNTVRVLSNKASKEALELENRGASMEDLLPFASGIKTKELIETGNLDTGVLACGQAVGLIHDVPTVKEVIDSIVTESKTIGQRLTSMGVFG